MVWLIFIQTLRRHISEGSKRMAVLLWRGQLSTCRCSRWSLKATTTINGLTSVCGAATGIFISENLIIISVMQDIIHGSLLHPGISLKKIEALFTWSSVFAFHTKHGNSFEKVFRFIINIHQNLCCKWVWSEDDFMVFERHIMPRQQDQSLCCVGRKELCCLYSLWPLLVLQRWQSVESRTSLLPSLRFVHRWSRLTGTGGVSEKKNEIHW